MEAAFREIIVGAGVESAAAVLFAVLVGNDHHRQRFQAGVFLDARDQLDAVHAGHVDVRDDEIEMAGAHRVPAVHAVHGDLDFVAAACEQLALELAHRERVVHDQHALAQFRFVRRGRPAHFAEPAAGDQFLNRAHHVLDIDDEHRGAVLHEGGGGDVLDFAEARVERLHDQLAFAEKTINHQRVGAARVADHDHGQLCARRFLFAALQNLVRRHEADLPAVEIEMLPAFEQFDFFPRELQGAHDVGEGERVGFAADVHEQRAHHRERER